VKQLVQGAAFIILVESTKEYGSKP